MIGATATWFDGGIKPGIRQAGASHRWQRCVSHQGGDVASFAKAHFGESHRRILLVGGAGFDPRSLAVASLLEREARGRLHAIFFRERRPNPDAGHLAQADRHAHRLKQLIPSALVVDVEVFESDRAVALGRNAIDQIRTVDLTSFSDVIVDFSALSIGSSFPVTRFLLNYIEENRLKANLHVVVTARPQTDDVIVPSPSDVVNTVHGFQGRWKLDETARAARLWMPQLRRGHQAVLDCLLQEIKPDDVVPVLPFPSSNPRAGDRLVEAYVREFQGRWAVDARSLVYADEANPLDFYRTVLRIHDGRSPVFEGTVGSQLILSPVGSKVLAIGAMMAAMERDLPVMYVEALSYQTGFVGGETYSDGDMVHVWLAGPDAYPPAA